MPKDPNQLATEVVRLSTDEPKPHTSSEISGYLAKIGRIGGLKGGKARSQKLSPEERKKIAQIAAQSRWKNR